MRHKRAEESHRRTLAEYLAYCKKRWNKFRIQIDFSYSDRVFTICQHGRRIVRPHEDWQDSGLALFDWALVELVQAFPGRPVDVGRLAGGRIEIY